MKKVAKSLLWIVLTAAIIFGAMVVYFLVAHPKVDYTTEEFELALQNGDVVEGKVVAIEVIQLEPDSAFGYNIQAGDHLNFVSAENPQVEKGDTIVVEIEKVASMFGSFIITYTQP